MQQLSEILNRNLTRKPTSKLNLKWEKAFEFGQYVGLPTTYVLKLFRDFGEDKVLALRSDLSDYRR